MELTQLLRANFPEVVCEIHEFKRPDVYTSIKVTITLENERSAWLKDL